ncbi:MAG: TetR family transcriptional regulator [Candidatus Binatia bacterium]
MPPTHRAPRAPARGPLAARQRPTRPRSDATRRRIIDAALQAFGARGYDGAMTRDIAAAAGIRQPLINYHFGSKDGLWRAAVAHLFAELRDSLAGRLNEVAGLPPPEAFAAMLRHFVLFTAQRPELSRLMIRESAARSPRLSWIVDAHLRPSFDAALALIRAAQRHGALPGLDPVSAYFLFVGAATSAFVMGPAYQLLTGSDPFSPARRAAYADAVVRLFLPPDARSRHAAAASRRPRRQAAEHTTARTDS